MKNKFTRYSFHQIKASYEGVINANKKQRDYHIEQIENCERCNKKLSIELAEIKETRYFDPYGLERYVRKINIFEEKFLAGAIDFNATQSKHGYNDYCNLLGENLLKLEHNKLQEIAMAKEGEKRSF